MQNLAFILSKLGLGRATLNRFLVTLYLLNDNEGRGKSIIRDPVVFTKICGKKSILQKLTRLYVHHLGMGECLYAPKIKLGFTE